MNFKITLILSLVFIYTANSRFLQSNTTNTTNTTTADTNNSLASITYSSSLRCGNCIKGGFVFCHKLPEGAAVDQDVAQINRTCCKDATCAQVSDPAWNCSNGYSDETVAQTFCPFNRANCGQQQKIQFSTKGQNLQITISNMTRGSSCVYKLVTKCGAPSFSLPQVPAGIDVEYLEVDRDSPDLTLDGNDTNDTSRLLAGTQGNTTNSTAPKTRHPKKDDPNAKVQRNVQVQRQNGTKNGTNNGKKAPVRAARFNATMGGTMTYGKGQSKDKQKGAKDRNTDSECSPKELDVEMTFVGTPNDTSPDSTSGTVLLQLSTVDFEDTTTSVGIFMKFAMMTVGLISLAFIL